MPDDESRGRANPVLWIMVGIPLIAVCAGILTVYLAVRGSEPTLPAEYAWEGMALERDQVRAERAATLGAAAELDFATSGQLRVVVDFADPAAPAPGDLELLLTHATLPALDRRLQLRRGIEAHVWQVAMPQLPRGNWLVEVAAPDQGWRLRGRFNAPTPQVRLGR